MCHSAGRAEELAGRLRAAGAEADTLVESLGRKIRAAEQQPEGEGLDRMRRGTRDMGWQNYQRWRPP